MEFNKDQNSYRRFRDTYAERLRQVVFWVGAGLSQPAGMPSWGQFRDKLAQEAREGALILEEPTRSHRIHNISTSAGSRNFWSSIGEIKEILGDSTYNAAVREIFLPAKSTKVPDLYNKIWKLSGVTGMVTLNVDGFAEKSHRTIRTQEGAAIFSGIHAKNYAPSIGAGRPFIANLHGQIDDSSSWIFSNNDLRKLLSDQGYIEVIRALFQRFCVVFIGISADDMAAGGILQGLVSLGIDLNAHYWITSRRDTEAVDWAKASSVELISYTPASDGVGFGGHEQPLREMFDNLASYVSRDKVPDPVISGLAEIAEMPPQRELMMMEDDQLRSTLSSYARYLIEKNKGSTDSEEYRKFLQTYSRSIHQSWHLTDRPPDNKFYGYIVDQKINGGSFSNVWRLHDDKSNYFALKIIHIDNLDKGPQLESFRRGVQSLTYLTNAGVPGTAKIQSAYELPPSVIMKFIDGINFSEVVKLSEYSFWKEGINIIINVCRHLRYGHQLPQGVLHRDVRPSNVMLPYYFWSAPDAEAAEADRFDATLLNYDMSWHSKAQGKTISGSAQEVGFYAPEQLNNIEDDSARDALVDSYGVGMVLYYAYAKDSPPTAGSSAFDWKETLQNKFRRDVRLKWASAVFRLRRLIFWATSVKASDRPFVIQIENELSFLQSAVSGNWTSLTPDMWAEEIICIATDGAYESENDNFSQELRAGRRLSVKGDLKLNSVILEFHTTDIGATNRTGVVKSWLEKLNTAKEILNAGGWKISDKTRYTAKEIFLHGAIEISDLRGGVKKIADGVARALNHVRLD